MSEPVYVPVEGGMRLQIARYSRPGCPETFEMRWPVLLVHGASANRDTFTTPDGGLARWLAERKFDPWLLEWRGSNRVVNDPVNRPVLSDRGDIFNFNTAADHDITAAIDAIRPRYGGLPIAIIGFCMGSGILAEAIARGRLRSTGVECVVLMTLGLFYETPIDGRLKSEERILERLRGTTVEQTGKPFLTIDPRVKTRRPDKRFDLETPWPNELEELYLDWPGRLRSHGEDDRATVQETCNRLCFLYGTPYFHGNLVEEIHGSDTVPAVLPDRFGAIPLHMFIHASRNVRHGHATVYDRTRSDFHDEDFISDEALEHFAHLQKVTLVTGDLNQLWHRNSIDLMHEWLSRGMGREKLSKHVVRGYGHQDLLWGSDARRAVYETIGRGLTVSGEVPKPEPC